MGMHLPLRADRLQARRVAAEVPVHGRAEQGRRSRIVDRAGARDHKHNPIVDRAEARSKLTEPDKADRTDLAQVKQATDPEPVARAEAVPDKPATARTIARLEITRTIAAARRITTVAARRTTTAVGRMQTIRAARRTATVPEQAALEIKVHKPATEEQAEQAIVPVSPQEPAMSR